MVPELKNKSEKIFYLNQMLQGEIHKIRSSLDGALRMAQIVK